MYMKEPDQKYYTLQSLMKSKFRNNIFSKGNISSSGKINTEERFPIPRTGL